MLRLHTKHHMIGRETLHATSLHPRVLSAQNSQKERRMTKFHNRWKHRKGMLLATAPRFYWVGVRQYRGLHPRLCSIAPTELSNAAIPRVLSAQNSQEEHRRRGWIIAGGEVH